jgi:hypothetical protein
VRTISACIGTIADVFLLSFAFRIILVHASCCRGLGGSRFAPRSHAMHLGFTCALSLCDIPVFTLVPFENADRVA